LIPDLYPASRSFIMRLNLFASLLLASAQIVFAQRYPAQDTLAIAAPYPAYMSDLAKEDAQGVFTGGTDVGKVKTGADTTAHRVNFDIPDPCRDCSFAADAGGKGGTISFGGDKKLRVDKLPATVKDSKGDIHEAKLDRGKPPKIKVSKIGSSGGEGLLAAANKTRIDLTQGRVDFAPAEGMIYAFDAWRAEYGKNTLWDSKYEKLGDYRVSAKAIAPGSADKAEAIITLAGNMKADSIKFVNGKGTVYQKKKINNNKYEIALIGGPAGDAQEIYALYPQGTGAPLTLGKLLLASYETKKRKLVLVPVNGAGLNNKNLRESVATALNKIYNKASVEWEVAQDENFEDLSWDLSRDGLLKVEGSGAWSVLTDEMKALNNAYRSKRTADPNTAYLFMLGQASAANGANILGDMPRAKQFGYLFVDGMNSETISNTAAHEIGHGVFQLQHVFEYRGIARGALSGNVMDYPSGTSFAKYQWDLIHDPGLVIGMFESDEDGELLLVDNLAGALVGGLVDISMQVAVNAYEKYYEKKDVSLWKITWWPDVAVSAGAGFVSSGASSLVKFTAFARTPVGRKALKIAIEFSTDFLINSVADLAKKYIDGEEQNYTQTLLFNFVGSATFASLNHTGLFNKFKDKIVQGAKKLPIKTMFSVSIGTKVNALRENIQEKVTQSVSRTQKKAVAKKQIANRVLTKSKIISEAEVESGELLGESITISKELKEAVELETKAIEREAKETIEEALPKEIDEAIKFSELRNAGDDLILNLVNKVDNVIDDVGKAALQAADVTDEIVKTSNSITDATKKFWANHEINCTNYLQQTYGRVNVGRQITVDITLSDRKAVTCRLDNLVKQGNTYKIIDAKSSIVSNLGVKNADDLVSRFSTPNQKTFYDALRNGQVRSIKPRGQRAADYFLGFGGIPDSGINVGNSVEFLVNDAVTDGYKIHKKIFEF